MAARTNEVNRPDGSAYRRAGTGPAVVLVHGYLGGSAQWQQVMDSLSGTHDVIAPDLPGFGDASSAQRIGRIEEFASHLLGLVDELGIDRFTLLGHSMGGMIAQEFSARFPDRVERLVLYGTGPLGAMPDRFESLDATKMRLRQDGVLSTVRRIGATWFCEGEAGPGFELIASLGAQANKEAALAALDAMGSWDGTQALKGMDKTTLVLWGDQDRSYRWPQVEVLWRGLPDSRLAVVPGAAHAVHLEKPSLFNAIVSDFLSPA